MGKGELRVFKEFLAYFLSNHQHLALSLSRMYVISVLQLKSRAVKLYVL